MPEKNLKFICMTEYKPGGLPLDGLLLSGDGLELISVLTVDELQEKLGQKNGFNGLIISSRLVESALVEKIAASALPVLLILEEDQEHSEPAIFHSLPQVEFVRRNKLDRESLLSALEDLLAREGLGSEPSVLIPAMQETLSSRFYSEIVKLMNEGVVAVDVSGTLIFMNEAFAAMIDSPASKALGLHISEFIVPDQRSLFIKELTEVIDNGTKLSFETVLLTPAADNMPVLGNASRLHNDENEIIGAFCTFNDISGVKEKERQLTSMNHLLREQASRDGLTGLWNHHTIHQFVREQFERSRSEDRKLTLMIIDIDYFKSINNSFGDMFGDAVLTEVVGFIKKAIRPHDIVGRSESDKFIVILDGIDWTQAMAVAEKIRAEVAENLFQYEDKSCRLTVSIGVTDLENSKAETARGFLEATGQALLKAKTEGRNTVSYYQDLLHKQLVVEKTEEVARIEKELVELADTSKRLYLEAAKALIAALEAKDPYTKTHSLNVAAYSVKIAREMGFSEDRVEMIRDAAQLHDIGKIAIPEHILLKGDQLNPQEFEVVKKHPLISVQILKKIKYLESELPIIQCHHERPDGRGYPGGLLGMDIPLGAQIVAVADAFDAMRSLRPYRGTLSLEDSVEELRKNSGTQFNPTIVYHLLKVLEREELKPERKRFLQDQIARLKQEHDISPER